MIHIKAFDSCKFNGRHFDSEIALIPQVVKAEAPPLTDDTLWITSANDSNHMAQSKHYTNEAFDFRVRNATGAKPPYNRDPICIAWANRVRIRLGLHYDVVLEIDHLHVERDVKVGDL